MSKDELPKKGLNADEEELQKTQQDIMRLKKRLEAQRKATELKQQELAQNKPSAAASTGLSQNVYNDDFYAKQDEPEQPVTTDKSSNKKFISANSAWETGLDTNEQDDMEEIFSSRGTAQIRPDTPDDSVTVKTSTNKHAPKSNKKPTDSGKIRIPLDPPSPSDSRRAVFESRPISQTQASPTDSRGNLRARPDLRRKHIFAVITKLSLFLAGGLLVLALGGVLGIYMEWHNKLPISVELKQQISQARTELMGAEKPAPPPKQKATREAPPRKLRTRPIPTE